MDPRWKDLRDAGVDRETALAIGHPDFHPDISETTRLASCFGMLLHWTVVEECRYAFAWYQNKRVNTLIRWLFPQSKH
jgi:hypothetical protein